MNETSLNVAFRASAQLDTTFLLCSRGQHLKEGIIHENAHFLLVLLAVLLLFDCATAEKAQYPDVLNWAAEVDQDHAAMDG